MRKTFLLIAIIILFGITCKKENELSSSIEGAALASNSTAVPQGKIMVIKCDTTYIDDPNYIPPPADTTVNTEPPAQPEKNIVFFGSSTIAQWKLEEAFPGQPVKKAGFGGRTWASLYTLADTISKLNPKQVVIYSGDNDVIARRTVANMTTDIQRLLNKIWTQNNNVPIVFLYTKPSDTAFKVTLSDGVTTGIQGIEYTNRNITNWAAKSHPTKLKVLNSHSPFILWNPKRIAVNYYQADKLHLNQSMGYPVLNQLVSPVLLN